MENALVCGIVERIGQALPVTEETLPDTAEPPQINNDTLDKYMA
jgi:hypothetical protein